MRGSWKAIALYPPSWVAMAAVVFAVAAILVVLEPSTLLSIVVVIVGIGAVFAWPLTLSATGILNHLRARAPKLSSVSETEVRMLGDQLDRLDDPRPNDQLREIRETHDRIVTLLDRRRQAGEMIYERYRSVAERVYFTVVANLREILADKTSSSDTAQDVSTDSDDGFSQEPSTGVSGDATGAVDSAGLQMVPLVANEPTYQDQPFTADDLLTQNDVAIAAMDRASGALGNAPIGLSSPDATAALKALQEVADQPGKYASR